MQTRLNKISQTQKKFHLRSTCCSFQKKKIQSFYHFFQDFTSILQTFSSSGKLLDKLQDFFQEFKSLQGPCKQETPDKLRKTQDPHPVLWHKPAYGLIRNSTLYSCLHSWTCTCFPQLFENTETLNHEPLTSVWKNQLSVLYLVQQRRFLHSLWWDFSPKPVACKVNKLRISLIQCITAVICSPTKYWPVMNNLLQSASALQIHLKFGTVGFWG